MEILTNFGIQPILLLAQIVNFLIILFLLKKFFYKPISKALEDRRQKIAESLKNAQEIEVKLAQTEEKSAQILEEARTNAQNLIEEAKKETERISAQAAADTRASIEVMMTEARVQMENQKQTMQKQLEKETMGLVMDVVKKVLGRTLKPQERQELTSKAAMEMTRKIQ